MNRYLVAAGMTLVITGCGKPPNDPSTLNGAFSQIENTVDDMHTNVFGPKYSGDLGSDPLGFSVTSFQKSVKGTPLEADADRLAKKVYEVDTLAYKRPPIAKLRTAVQELKDVVADIKKKL
jgi:hypothetical protein